MTPDDPRHGKVAGYIAKCKCEACALAWFRYCKRRRALLSQGIPLTVPNVGYRRRVRALQAMGWSLASIAIEAGDASNQVIADKASRATITIGSHQRMIGVYNRLSMSPGPSNSARVRARSKGWPPPLAWDDESIDDPDAQPYKPRTKGANPELHEIDPVIVDRAMNGERVKANTAERAEVVRRWLAAGRSRKSLEEAQGWNLNRDHRRYAA